jgi:hypothetical protein
MFFIDELDGDDGLGRVVWDSFADATNSAVSDCSNTGERDVATYEAYAPCPMVLLTSRKGRSVGRGAIWLLGGAGPMVSAVKGRRGRRT